MDAIVQLIRNALCCVKDLGWFRESIPMLYDADVLPQYYRLDEPFNQTTPLELMIGITQLYATISMCSSGWRLIHTSYGKLVRTQRILAHRQQTKKTSDKDKTTNADRLVTASLIKESMFAMRSMFIGALIFAIGGAFFWLAANSVHASNLYFFGGYAGVIHSLTVAELGLLPLLYYMWRDAQEQFQKAARMDRLAAEMMQQQSLQQNSRLNMADIDLASFEALTNWLPFWDSGISIFGMKIPESAVEEKMVATETLKVQRSLEEFVFEKKEKDDKKKDDNDNNQNITVLHDKARELQQLSRIVRLEGYRELVFFGLNAIAFYSYMFCVIVFYFQKEDSKPLIVRTILFGLDNPSADWHGNFWGDLMWTIEPIVLLSSTVVFASMRKTAAAATQQEQAKVKAE